MSKTVRVLALLLLLTALLSPAAWATPVPPESLTPSPALSPSPTPSPTARPGKPPRVSAARFSGNTVLSEAQLAEAISNSGPKYFWSKKRDFSTEELEKDRVRIVNLYKAHGYYDANVSAAWEWKRPERRALVSFGIIEGQPVRVGKLDFSVADAQLSLAELAGWREDLATALVLQTGDNFTLERWKQCQTGVMSIAGNRSRARAELSAKAVIRRAEHSADLQLAVMLGPECRIGRVLVQGLDKVRYEDISPEITLAPGQPVSAQELGKTQSAVYDLGYFRSVSVLPRLHEEDPALVDVDVKLKERKFRRVRFTIGYGSEDRLRTRLSWSRDYLWHGPRTFEAAARYSSLVTGVETSLTQRFWPWRDSTVKGTVFADLHTTDAYDLLEWGLKPTFQHRFGKLIQVTTGYGLTRQFYRNIFGEVDGSLRGSDIVEEEWFTHAYLFGALRLDATDNRLNPQRGWRLISAWRWANRLVLSDPEYWKGSLEAHYFLRLAERWVLAMRGEVGFGEATGDSTSIPPAERYYTGGSASVRGYRYQLCGPLDGGGSPVGGSTLLLGNLELRFPLYKDILGGVIFGDAGYVWPEPFFYNLEDVLYSTGAGLRIYTPIGPIRIDYGHKLNPVEGDGDRWRIHFSITHTF